jgi:hypothetical protein
MRTMIEASRISTGIVGLVGVMGAVGTIGSMGMLAGTLVFTSAASAHATSISPMNEAERRCAIAILAARRHVQATDTRALSHCALAVLSEAAPRDAEAACRPLRTAYLGSDLVDRRATVRIADWCAVARPRWIASSCEGPGPWSGRPVATGYDVARCVVSSGHCAARRLVESVLGDLAETVGAQNPENLMFEYGELAGNSFADCASEATSACPR